jgi:hypothetical protein
MLITLLISKNNFENIGTNIFEVFTNKPGHAGALKG